MTVAYDTSKQDGVLDLPDLLGALEQYSIDPFKNSESFPTELPHLSHKIQSFASLVFVKSF